MVEIRAPQSLDEPADEQSLIPPKHAQPPRADGTAGKITVGQQDSIDSEAITQSTVVPPPVDGEWHSAKQTGAAGERFLRDPDGEEPSRPHTTSRARLAAGTEATQDEIASASWALQSASAQKRRQWLLVSLILLFGLVASSVLFVQFVARWKRNSKQVEVAAASDVSSKDAQDAVTDEAASPQDHQPQDGQVTETPSAGMPTDAPEPGQGEGGDANAEQTSVAMEDSATIDGASAEPAEGDLPDESIPATVPPADSAMVARSEAPKPNAPLTDLPAGLQKFAPLMSFDTTGNQDARPLEAPPSIDTVRMEDAAKELEKGESKPGRKAIDVKRAMSLRFAIDNRGASLWELALVLGQLTTVPIELDLISFDAAGIQVDRPMASPKGSMTAQDWLNRFCQDNGLIPFVLPDRIVISANEPSIVAGLAPAFSIEDIPGDRNALLLLLQRVAQEPEPDEGNDAEPAEAADAPKDAADADAVDAVRSITLSADGLTIVPESSPHGRMRAALTLETIRQTYGLKPKLAPEFTSRWAGLWPSDNASPDAAKLGEWPLVTGGKSLGTFDSPRATAGILRELATLNQSSLMVVWSDAVFQDLYPADALMPYSKDDDAGSLLIEILGEQNLEARVAGKNLWLVLTAATYDRLEVITWLPIPAGSESQVKERLAASLGIVDSDAMPLGFVNNGLIIRCPRYLARQLSRVISP